MAGIGADAVIFLSDQQCALIALKDEAAIPRESETCQCADRGVSSRQPSRPRRMRSSTPISATNINLDGNHVLSHCGLVTLCPRP